jgi:hypothetical protein
MDGLTGFIGDWRAATHRAIKLHHWIASQDKQMPSAQADVVNL